MDNLFDYGIYLHQETVKKEVVLKESTINKTDLGLLHDVINRTITLIVSEKTIPFYAFYLEIVVGIIT